MRLLHWWAGINSSYGCLALLDEGMVPKQIHTVTLYSTGMGIYPFAD
jgi:hypothetical protein